MWDRRSPVTSQTVTGSRLTGYIVNVMRSPVILIVQPMILYMRTNNLMADFSYAQSSTLSVLYNSYCMNVYGSHLSFFNNYKSVERFLHCLVKNY